jgi:hypothetical protein
VGGGGEVRDEKLFGRE